MLVYVTILHKQHFFYSPFSRPRVAHACQSARMRARRHLAMVPKDGVVWFFKQFRNENVTV